MKHPLELTVMMYHYVRDPGDEAERGSGILGLSVGDFEKQLDELAQRHNFVSWSDVRATLEEDEPLPHSACLLTFDDGVRDHYINAFKILRDRNISGLFFAMTRHEGEGLVLAHKIHFLLAKLGLEELQSAIWKKLDDAQREQFTSAEKQYRLKYPPVSLAGQINLLKAVLQRDLSPEVDTVLSELFEQHVGSEVETARDYYLNSSQIREMTEGGMHFGGHSHSHPWFDWINAEQRNQEIVLSTDFLRQIEPGPWAFAYPYGGLHDDAPELLKSHGFVAAFTTQTQLTHSNPFLIGRLDGEEIAHEGHGYA